MRLCTLMAISLLLSALLLLPAMAEETGVLPAICIETDGGAPIQSKTEYIPCAVTIESTNAEWSAANVDAQIRGRGNNTWFHCEKKSYRVKFTQKLNPLGVGDGPAKSWVLLANHCDKSMMRNHLAQFMASRMEGIDVACEGVFVELYLNGRYDGVYYLCEQVQAGDYRVPVDDSSPDGGWLVELDGYAAPDDEGFFSVGDRRYVVKSEVYNDAQVAAVADYIADVDAAIMAGNRDALEALVDLDSLVDVYLLEEFFINSDAGWSSFFMYKSPDTKMIFGPVWDFDLSAGNDNRYAIYGTDAVCIGEMFYEEIGNQWFIALFQQPWFIELAKERWALAEDTAEEMLEECDRISWEYQSAFDRNFVRWPVLNTQINLEPPEVLALTSFTENAEFLYYWLMARKEWMDWYWGL